MNGQGRITTEDGEEAMDYITDEGDEYKLKNLTALSEYKVPRPVPIELDREDENLENRMEVVIEMVEKEKAASTRTGNSYSNYTDDQKTLFLYYLKIKFFSAAKSAKMSGVSERTGQTWAKKIKTEPDWDIYEKKTNLVNRPQSQLQEEQKKHIIEFYDNKPFATVDEAVESLTTAFEGFNLKRTTVNNFIVKECNLSMKKLSRQPKSRNDTTRINNRYE
ncbi:hypothetical protein MFLAVUS_000026 [Mucor flavus]|uniref:Transposase n=1 Tax=Mucor flavus TaxID=439312 RepID=A0ABP9YIJ3_9FUNG